MMMPVYSEDRGAATLLSTAQHNRCRAPSPPPPKLPDTMMSKERAIRVSSQLTFYHSQSLIKFLLSAVELWLSS